MTSTASTVAEPDRPTEVTVASVQVDRVGLCGDLGDDDGSNGDGQCGEDRSQDYLLYRRTSLIRMNHGLESLLRNMPLEGSDLYRQHGCSFLSSVLRLFFLLVCGSGAVLRLCAALVQSCGGASVLRCRSVDASNQKPVRIRVNAG